MDANELRERVACAIPLPLLTAKDAERVADAAIRIVAEACAEAARKAPEFYASDHIRALIPKEPNNG